jgi:hypothetical protein
VADPESCVLNGWLCVENHPLIVVASLKLWNVAFLGDATDPQRVGVCSDLGLIGQLAELALQLSFAEQGTPRDCPAVCVPRRLLLFPMIE